MMTELNVERCFEILRTGARIQPRVITGFPVAATALADAPVGTLNKRSVTELFTVK
jgi:hypothetical protein